MFSFAKANNPEFPDKLSVNVLCHPKMCVKYLSQKYGINVKEMLKAPDKFEDIPNMKSLLPNGKKQKGKDQKYKSYYLMKNYGLTEAGYGYVSELLKFSQPASKETRHMMAENRKNTIEAKSTYEKELESQQRSASAKGHRKASMTNEQKALETQQRRARAKARIANMTDEQKALDTQQRSARANAGHATRRNAIRNDGGGDDGDDDGVKPIINIANYYVSAEQLMNKKEDHRHPNHNAKMKESDWKNQSDKRNWSDLRKIYRRIDDVLEERDEINTQLQAAIYIDKHERPLWMSLKSFVIYLRNDPDGKYEGKYKKVRKRQRPPTENE